MELPILYGSQTGTAEDIAEYIWRCSKNFSFSGPIMALNDFSFSKLLNSRLAVFVVSTTGCGEEPDNMKFFWKVLLRKSLPANSLKHLKFACLGLGDSSYAKYNFAAKKLYKRLIQLSASPIIPIGLCDEQHDLGIGAVFIPWADNLWYAFQEQFPGITKDFSNHNCFKWQVKLCTNSETSSSKKELVLRSHNDLHRLILERNVRTTAGTHFQDVRLLHFNFPNNLMWSPGASISVWPYNSGQIVEDFFQLVSKTSWKCNRDMTVSIKNTDKDMPIPTVYQSVISFGKAAKYYWDLNALPRQRAFELLAFNCEDKTEKSKLIELSIFEGLSDYLKYIHKPRRTILELLHDFPSATAGLTPQIMFELFPIIKPRIYSIASIPETRTLDVLVAVVEYKTILSSPRLGLCSNWLKNLKPGEDIFATLNPPKIKFPIDIRTPLIMVSTGTGLAPFRSIMLHREALLKINIYGGDLIIFLGCRNKDKDFHCQDDFNRFERMDLIKCFTAFSRDTSCKIYVQHLITQNSAFLENMLLKTNCTVLIVGSSKNMPKAVKEAFIEVVGGKYSLIEDMIKTGRYQEETWT